MREFQVPMLLLTAAALALSGCRAQPVTPLAQAAFEGEVETLGRLLAEGESAREFDCAGMAPLHWAARGGQAEAIRLLAEAGAPVNALDRRATEWTPLMHAVHKRQPAAVTALLAAGALPDARARSGPTALILAAGYGQLEIVTALLEAGADPRAETPGGINALWSAAGGAAIADITDGPAFGTCHPDVIALLRAKAPDLRIHRSLSAQLLSSLSRTQECSRLLAELQE